LKKGEIMLTREEKEFVQATQSIQKKREKQSLIADKADKKARSNTQASLKSKKRSAKMSI